MATWLDGALPGRGSTRRHAEHPACGFAKRRAAVERHLGHAMLAMCAARLDEPERAIQLLAGRLKTTLRPRIYHPRRPDAMYMPATWLLSAVAMMAAGWDGHTGTRRAFRRTGRSGMKGCRRCPKVQAAGMALPPRIPWSILST